MAVYQYHKNDDEDRKIDWIGSIGRIARIIATLIGLFCIILGMLFGVRLFTLIYETIEQPESFLTLYNTWVQLMIEIFKLQNANIEIASIIVIFFLGASVFMLILIAFLFMSTGAKIVSLTSSDREAIIEILRYAFGPKGRVPHVETKPELEPKSNK